MLKKVFTGVGHGGPDSGASSDGLIERDINLVMALEFDRDIRRHGVENRLSRTTNFESDPLTDEIRECNSFLPNKGDGVAIDIHNNSGKGDGFEIFYSKGSIEGKRLAECIEREVIKIGQNSRGVKIKVASNGTDYFGFVRDTRVPAVIVEGFFLDNTTDRQIADTVEEQKSFGRAYAKGVLNYLGIAYKGEDKPQTSSDIENNYTVKVTADVLNVREGAGTGFKVNTTVKNGEVYTVIEESDGWGKLKSGVGWISLVYTSKIGNIAPENSKRLNIGSKIKLIGSNYATGERIPSWAKTSIYTVQQLKDDKVLVKELVSWVNIKDIKLV